MQKVKSIKGFKYHTEVKYWSFPNTDCISDKILEVFKGEKIHINPTVPIHLSAVVAREKVPKQFHSFSHVFQDIIRDLFSIKYSYKTVKVYIYFNKDFLSFTSKNHDEINDMDIKDYLLYLAEEKQFATLTLNQAINALRFYYGSMLKKKLVYEVKRPHKSKKNFWLF